MNIKALSCAHNETCVDKIKLELMHIDKEVCYYKSLQQVTYNNESYIIYIYVCVYYCNKIDNKYIFI